MNSLNILLVGNSNYPKEKILSDIPNVLSNLTLLEKELEVHSASIYSNTNVQVLENLKKQSVLKKTIDFCHNTSPNDTIIFFLSVLSGQIQFKGVFI